MFKVDWTFVMASVWAQWDALSLGKLWDVIASGNCLANKGYPTAKYYFYKWMLSVTDFRWSGFHLAVYWPLLWRIGVKRHLGKSYVSVA